MPNKYTAVLRREDDCWIGWIEEVPSMNCQDNTRTELLNDLRETLKEALEMNRREALAFAGESGEEEPLIV